MLHRPKARGNGGVDRFAVTLQNDLPSLIGCGESELVTMPRHAAHCQRAASCAFRHFVLWGPAAAGYAPNLLHVLYVEIFGGLDAE